MTHAIKTLTGELAYLRSLHAEAMSQCQTVLANLVAEDIADCERALEVLNAQTDIAQAA